MGSSEPRLGVDIGRVIISGESHPDGGDTAFFQGDEAALLRTPEIPDAVSSIAALVPRFDGRVWLVSKCGPRTQARTLVWLRGHDFYGRTGIDPSHVRFCRERAEKRTHADELGLTHFVDDRVQVHEALRGAVAHLYLFGPQEGPVPDFVVPVASWPRVRDLIEATLSPPSGAPAATGS